MPTEMSLRSGAPIRDCALSALLAIAAVLVAGAPAFAAEPPPGPEYHSARATRIEASQAPIIDGDLTDPIWANADVIDGFHQESPNVGEPSTERTVVRVLYDEDNLYISIYAYDERPDDIVVRAMARDGDMAVSDNLRVMLDPGPTRRNGYSFQVSAAGGRRDGLIQNNATVLYEWNAIWQAEVRVVADGWVTEMAIPFRSMSYDPNQTVWGLDINRTIRHKNEVASWSGYNPVLGFSDVSLAGNLTGLSGMEQGLGLDVQVYATGRLRHVAPGTEGTDLSGTAGGNIYYKLTPALTGTLTFNPDFSDSPLDARQVNTTRFSLFFEETRDFFLQDAAAFEFGGNNFVNNSSNARPFFSRNIGLVQGRPVSIIGGGKLSGEFAGFGIGALSVVTADQGTAPQQLLSVARITRPVFSESKIGFIVTNGDPTGATDSTVAGVDFQYRNSNLFGADIIAQADLYYERSFSDTYGDDNSFGIAFNFPNEPWGGRFRFKQVGENFRPALGFANRRGTRRYEGRLSRRQRFRDAFLREITASYEGEFITGLDDQPQSWLGQGQFLIESRDNDRFSLRSFSYFERIDQIFDLPNDVPVPIGDYSWHNFGFNFQSSATRRLQIQVSGECCTFFNGDGYKIQTTINWRPNRYFEFQPAYEGEFIRLPTGDVDIHILTLNSVVNFTPDMQLVVEAQWDNISQGFTFSGRYLWEYTPGNELFIGFGQTAILPRLRYRDFDPQVSLLTVRLGRTFQF
jgi:hypothetical protein